MKILIVGSGVAGGLIGARLIEKKCNVTFLVRPERKVQLLTTGLALYSPYGKFRRHVPAIVRSELTGQYDLIIVTCRAQDYDTVLKMLTGAIGPDTIVLPVIEGAGHLHNATLPNGGRFLGGMLEARTLLDADGVLHQRAPLAELHIGALHPDDNERAGAVAELLTGRGIKTMLSDRILSAIWERFCFTAAAVAVNVRTNLSLRDAVSPTHHITEFDRLLSEGRSVGERVGLLPCSVKVSAYRKAFRMETRPVQPPALIADGGRRADECVFLLMDMVTIAESAGAPVPRLRAARDLLLGAGDKGSGAPTKPSSLVAEQR